MCHLNFFVYKSSNYNIDLHLEMVALPVEGRDSFFLSELSANQIKAIKLVTCLRIDTQ